MKKIALVFLAASILVATTMPAYKVGDAVDPFSLKNVDGKIVSLADYKNEKGVIIIFDCNTCPFSKLYNGRIIELNKKYKGKGFPVVAVNANAPEISPGDSFDEMVKHAKKNKYDFPYLFDENQEVATTFGASNTPHVFVLKKDGESFKIAYIGAIDDNARDEKSVSKRYVEEAVESILAGKPIAVEKTKAIGCGIKYRKK